jgi:integrase
MIDGRADSMGLGAVNTTSLAKAREKAQQARDLLQEGINPREARDAERLQRKAEAAKTVTFKQCVDAYIAANRASWRNAQHTKQWLASFNETRHGKRVYPAATQAINDLPVKAIDTGLVLKVIELLWAKTPESASRIRGRIEAVLDYAKVREYRDGENPARWRGHLDKILPKRGKGLRGHHVAIPYAEMPEFMAQLREKQGLSARALEFTILTAARTGETRGARWSEIDIKTKMWTIPAERMKAAKTHRVPLSDRTLEARTGRYDPGITALKENVKKMLEDIRNEKGEN